MIVEIGTGAVAGAIIVIRFWRRTSDRDTKTTVTSVESVVAAPSGDPATENTTIAPGAPADVPLGTAIPIPTAQS